MRKVAIYQRKRTGASSWYNKWIQSPVWLKGFGLTVLLCLLLYIANSVWGELSPGSGWGLGYGIAAAVLFVGSLFYAGRRKVIRVGKINRAWYYLQFHVYGGTLFLGLMLMHTNFSLPGGVLTWLLWVLSFWIVLTGWLGSVLQKWIPTVLNANLNTEVNFNRIPELMQSLQKKALGIVEQSGEEVASFYQKHLDAGMQRVQFRWIYFFDVAGTIHRELLPFDHLGRYLGGEDKARLGALKEVYQAKLEMDVHYTLQSALRTWLWVHIPIAIITAVLLLIHVFAVVYY